MIRGYERVAMPKPTEELKENMKAEYEDWFKYDFVRNPVLAMTLLGEAYTSIRQHEDLISDLQSEIQRLNQIAQY